MFMGHIGVPTKEACQIKSTLIVNPANMSDFKKAFRRKHKMLLSDDSKTVNHERVAYFNPAGATQNAEIKYKSCLTFDELLLLAHQYVP